MKSCGKISGAGAWLEFIEGVEALFKIAEGDGAVMLVLVALGVGGAVLGPGAAADAWPCPMPAAGACGGASILPLGTGASPLLPSLFWTFLDFMPGEGGGIMPIGLFWPDLLLGPAPLSPPVN